MIMEIKKWRVIIMPVVYVYNPDTNNVERSVRGLGEPMPYIIGNTLTVGEFRANSRSSVIWTDKRVMQAWNVFRRQWGRPIPVGFAFKRVWEGGHAIQSEHYAGTALDIGQRLSPTERNQLRVVAINSGVWSLVEPAYLTPTWVHVDKRQGSWACGYPSYPALALGSKGVYVFVLQDSLNVLGYTGSGLDGVFGPGTQRAVRNFQTAERLPADGVVGCETWNRLETLATGIGLTGTVVNP